VEGPSKLALRHSSSTASSAQNAVYQKLSGEGLISKEEEKNMV
jgi:hypothetical protein